MYRHLSFTFCDVGHAVWPAVVLDDSRVAERKGLKKGSGEKAVLVQFFGTHDFARYYQFLSLFLPTPHSGLPPTLAHTHNTFVSLMRFQLFYISG